MEQPVTQQDIFDVVAEQIFKKRGLVADPAWCAAIAGEFRGAMRELGVNVKPPAPPKERTLSVALLLHLAAIEAGDIGVEIDTQQNPKSEEIWFVSGHWKFAVHYAHVQGGRPFFDEICAVIVPHGQLIRETLPEWVRGYVPHPYVNAFNAAAAAIRPELTQIYADQRFGWRKDGTKYVPYAEVRT